MRPRNLEGLDPSRGWLGITSTMKTYWVHVRPVGHGTMEVREVACADDGALLLDCFAMLADHQTVEAWDGERLVCRLTRPKSSEARSLQGKRSTLA